MKNQQSTRLLLGSPSRQLSPVLVLHDRSGLPISSRGDTDMKVCTKCGEEKPENEFYIQKMPGRPGYRRPQCKRCSRPSYARSARKFYHADPLRGSIKNRIRCCRKNTVSDGSVTAKAITRLLWDQGGKCAVSGALMRGCDWDIDHIWPKCEGGENSMLNIQLVTPKINGAKGKRIPWEYCYEIPPGWLEQK